jgi:hypothetical protein
VRDISKYQQPNNQQIAFQQPANQQIAYQQPVYQQPASSARVPSVTFVAASDPIASAPMPMMVKYATMISVSSAAAQTHARRTSTHSKTCASQQAQSVPTRAHCLTRKERASTSALAATMTYSIPRDTKYDSNTGWPSFYSPANTSSVVVSIGYDMGYARDEVCALPTFVLHSY